MMTVYYLRTSVCINIHIHLGLRPQLVLQVLLKRTLGPDELHIGTIPGKYESDQLQIDVILRSTHCNTFLSALSFR